MISLRWRDDLGATHSHYYRKIIMLKNVDELELDK